MRGSGRWIAVIVASVAAVAVMGLLATQVKLSNGVEERCGTTLRLDLRDAENMRDGAANIEAGSEGPMTSELVDAVAGLNERAASLEDRCKGRQTIALLGLGTGVAVAGAAIALSTYKLGHSAGEKTASNRH